jgi:hypothetical protein
MVAINEDRALWTADSLNETSTAVSAACCLNIAINSGQD